MNTRAEGTLGRPCGRLLIFVWAALLLCVPGAKAEPVKTVVQDTLYRANGQVAQGMLTVRWNSFSTSAGEAVPAGELTATIGANGSIAIPLIPNVGSSPSGSYYKVIFKLNDGTASEEQWVVPVAATTTVAEIRAKVVPQAVAAQFASREYVDAALAAVVPASVVHLAGAETITGAKTFTVSPEVPTTPAAAGAAVARAYVDEQFAGLAPVATTGDYNDLLNKPTTTGATADLASPGPIGSTEPGPVNATSYAVNGVPLSSTNLSDGPAVARTNQANIFTQPQTMPDSITGKTPVADIRAYGAVCDGSTDDTAAFQAAVTALGAGGGTILIPGLGNGCYVANPTGITWPSYTGTLQIKVQGKLKAGSTIVSKDLVDWIGEGGSIGAQFHGAGPIARIDGPTASGTLGTSCIAGTSCTFTPSAMTGIKTGGAISVAGKSTCTITSIARASNVVTATLSAACHLPPGINAVIAGVTDSGFNGTFMVSRADYPLNTLSWLQTGSNGSSSGGTVVGYNEDSVENAVITATTGTTATATFVKDHASTDSFGIVGMYVTGAAHHQLKGISLTASGTALWLYNASQAHLDGVSITSFSIYGGLELNQSFWNWINDSSFMTVTGLSSWGIRLTNASLSSGSGSGLLYITDTVVGGGIKMDRGTTYGQGNLYLKNVTSEQTMRGMVTIDNTNTLLQNIVIENSLVQDNFSGVYHCFVSSLYPTISGTVKITGVNTVGTSCMANHYYNGHLEVGGVSATVDVKGATEGVAQTDLHGVNVIQNGIAEMELRGGQASMSPSLVPHATLPVPQANAWTTGGGCTVATGTLAPDGTTNAATLTYSSGNGSLNVYNYWHTPQVGDVILFSAWVKGPAGQFTGATTFAGSLLVGGGGSGFAYDGGGGSESALVAAEGYGYSMSLANDWWHPVVGAARITSTDGNNHNISLQADCSTTGISYYNPTMIYIPASEGVEMREIARWRQQLLHGYTPPNVAAGTLGIFPEGKLNWGGDTNLYRGAAGVVQTDGAVAAQKFSVNGIPLTADASCAAGNYWIAPIAGSVNKWRKCENGTLSDIGGGSGTVTAVTASSPIASSGGSTPNITLVAGALPDGMTAATQSQGNNSTKVATTAYVDAGLAANGGASTPNAQVSFNQTAGTAVALIHNLNSDKLVWRCFDSSDNALEPTSLVLTDLDTATAYFSVAQGYCNFNATGGGTGDVTGPASSTNGRLASFNGTDGKVIQDSGVLTSAVRTTAGGQTIAAADTLNGLPSGCQQWPCRVATVPLATYSGTAGTSNAPIYTPSADGVFRMCGTLEITTAGTGGIFQLQSTITYSTHQGVNFPITFQVPANTQWNTSSNSATPASSCQVFAADASQAIYWKLGSTATGSPTVRYSVTLEQMQ